MRNSFDANGFDFGWFREHLLTSVLPHWLRCAVTEEGLFSSGFDRAWRPTGPQLGTLVTQGRLLYNFSKGYELTGRGEYRQAVEAGGRFLLEHFRDRRHGGWFWSCDRSGQALETVKNAYGHAFALFGLSHAAAATGRPDFAEAARETWGILRGRFFDSCGGLWQKMTRDFQPVEENRSQNPMMHLFEALLALGDMDPTGGFHDDATAVADFVIGHGLRDGGLLPELYDANWRELPAEQGGGIDIGHLFEWSFLLSTAAERGLGDDYLSVARRMLESGMRIGFDTSCGGIFSVALPDGRVKGSAKGWWQQAEAVRALIHFAFGHGWRELRRPLDECVEFVKHNFVDHEYGGWYRSYPAGGDPDDRHKGSLQKVGYHVVGMCMEAHRLGIRNK